MSNRLELLNRIIILFDLTLEHFGFAQTALGLVGLRLLAEPLDHTAPAFK